VGEEGPLDSTFMRVSTNWLLIDASAKSLPSQTPAHRGELPP